MIVRGRELHLQPRRGGVAAHARRRPVAVGGPRHGIVHGRKGHAARAPDHRAHETTPPAPGAAAPSTDGPPAASSDSIGAASAKAAPAAATAGTTGTIDVGLASPTCGCSAP